ncbi:hypothetical protein M2454_001032 [Aequitasia blattaphilus]|uniref:Type 4 fimbrial biogenesis protein PilX N-terminal domain-containing protein n=1 Tax=Aequitasia blattaphilus TaxID=2949332 RepID=A0ABT1E951_9FIRM|nr:hypothetical protein [Aequitasia blattaphilus]MCP1102360.1 hypothetical protein [Aequitasia blattaphilus]MCR8615000.1 hypothetical protein [Aequitasia blattaphilus]
MRKKNGPITNIGTVSLLMIFIVLCLVILSTLSLATASRDHTLSKKVAQHNQAYYTASMKVNEQLKNINNIAKNNSFKETVTQLSSIEDLLLETDSETIYVSFTQKINPENDLSVSITIKNQICKITSWEETPTEEWAGDDTYDLL